MVSGIPERAGTYFFTCELSPGTNKTFSIVVHPAPASTDATLSGLAPSAGTLDPAFAPGVTHYAMTVPAATSTITVTPTAADTRATLTVNGMATSSGAASAPITLSVGSNTITVVSTAEDGITTASYTIAVTRGAPASISFNPAGGALPEAMAGEEYSMPLSATGVAPIVFSLSAGALPEGMQLNASTGELTGLLAEGSEGQYTFTLEARGSDSSSATASFTLTVVERAITVSDKTVDVPAGSTPANVNLTRGATGGPFTSAVIVSVEPANAGTAEIVDAEPTQALHQKTAHAPAYAAASESALYLKFVPNGAYAGRATVKFQLTSDLGASNVGSVIYNLSYDTAAVARKIDGHVRSFVHRRMSLLASNIGAPDLLERRRASAGEDAATGSVQPNAGQLAAGFSTDLARINGSRGDGAAEPLPFNVWIDGTLLAHNRDENGDRWGTFGLISGGVDYLATDKALLGVSLHLDHMRDPTEDDVTLTGRGWLAGPYGSFEIVDNVFFNAHLLHGTSSNDVDTTFFDGRFDSRRWLLDTSVTGQWQLDEVTTLTPRLRALYFDETVRDYRVSNAAGDAIGLPGFTQKQFRVSFGADFERRIELKNGLTLIPNAGLTGGFAGLDGSGAFGSVVSGVTLSNQDKWTTEAGVRFDMEGDGQVSTGGRLGFSMRCVCN
ncbi:MAG TPA: cadherin-like beta sandwich domain-containing protein, partial [Steroidobacter sp.]|nr:cadherin-like beta sandwich domain-containing protein [Steroidobacter sp.]